MKKYFKFGIIIAAMILTAAIGIYKQDVFSIIITFCVIDFTTGIIKSSINKTLSSSVGFIGICKKTLLLLFSIAVMTLGDFIGKPELFNAYILFYIANEMISIIENCNAFIEIPESLVNILEKIKNENE